MKSAMHETNKIWDPGTIAPYMRKGSTACQEHATLVKLRQVHVRIRSVAPTIWSAHRSTHLCAAVPLTQGCNAPDSLRPGARNSGLQALRPIAPLVPSFYPPISSPYSLSLCSLSPALSPLPYVLSTLPNVLCPLPFALCPWPPTVPSTPPHSHLLLFFLPSLLSLLRHPRSTAQTHRGAKAVTQQGQKQGEGSSIPTVAADQLGLQIQWQQHSRCRRTAVAATQQVPPHSSRSRHTAVAAAQQSQPHSSRSRTAAAAATQHSQPHSSSSHTAVAAAQQ